MLRVALFVLAASTLAVACTPPTPIGFNGGAINPSCEKDAPYCIRSDNGLDPLNPTYKCASCVDNCDCKGYNEYCDMTIGGGDRGTCIKWETKKKDCLPYSTNDLQNASIDDEYKCAELYDVPVTAPATPFKGINHRGACVEGKCYFCWPGVQTHSCGYGSGLQQGRTCVWGGDSVNLHSAAWAQGNYYENVNGVWWAIFFCFFILLLCCQLAQTVKIMGQ